MDPASRLDTISRALEALVQEVQQVRRDLARERSDEVRAAQPIEAQLTAFASYLALGGEMEESKLLTTVLRCGMYVTSACGAALTLFDQQKRKLVYRAAVGDGAEGIVGYEIPLEGSQHGLALATGEIQASTPLHTAIEDVAGVEFRNILVAPLMVQDEPVGTLSAVNKVGGEQFTAEDMEAYKLFSDLAALVVRQRTREQLVRQAVEPGPATMPEELAGLAVGERDHQLMDIADKIAWISRHREEILPTIRQIIDAIARV